MAKIMMCAATLAGCAGLASALSFQADFTNYTGTTDIQINSNTQPGGHMGFVYTGPIPGAAVGQFENPTFNTFCIEMQSVNPGPSTYDVVKISQAPNPTSGNPDAPYTVGDEDEVHAVVAAAITLGWINNDLSSNGATNAQLAAIQAGIWDVLFDSRTITASGQTATDLGTLMAAVAADPTARVTGLHAMVSALGQDQLYVIPLPPAALAGLATLGLVAGVSRLRRR